MEEIKIVLLDYQQLFREGVKRVLDSESSFQVIESSNDYSTISSTLSSEDIDVILVDILIFRENMDRMKEQIIDSTNTKVIVMATEGEEYYIRKTMKLGVHGYLLKEMDVFSFVEAIKKIHQGTLYVHAAVTHDLVEDYRRLLNLNDEEEQPKVRRPLHLYTKRECEVLQLLTDGKSNRQIAEALNISEKTVKNHVSSLFKKMKVNDRTQAVVTAIKNNWVELK